MRLRRRKLTSSPRALDIDERAYDERPARRRQKIVNVRVLLGQLMLSVAVAYKLNGES